MLGLLRSDADLVSGTERLIRLAEFLRFLGLRPDAAFDFFEDHGRQCVLLIIHAEYKAQTAKKGKREKKCDICNFDVDNVGIDIKKGADQTQHQPLQDNEY